MRMLNVLSFAGYGNIAPKTFWGRIVCIAYAVVGIPLMLLCLANIGDAFAKFFRFFYTQVQLTVPGLQLWHLCVNFPRNKLLDAAQNNSLENKHKERQTWQTNREDFHFQIWDTNTKKYRVGQKGPF